MESQSPRRFVQLRLENWRNFTQLDVSLQRRVFIVGPNASGKSNLLDVFRFLREIVSVGGGLQQAVRRRGGVKSLRALAAREKSDLRVFCTVAGENGGPTWEYELCFSQDSQRRPFIRQERVKRDELVLLQRPDSLDLEDKERLTQTHLEQVQANRNFRELVGFFASVRYLHIVPQLIREPERSVGRVNDPYGGDFLEQIASSTPQTQRSRLGRITKALRVAVPQLVELKLERDSKGTPHLQGRYEHWRPHGAWQNEESFSDGTLRLLGLLWATLDGSGPLLLEEPELTLHPGVIQYLPQMFARLQRKTGRQIILSTHSSELLRDNDVGVDEVILLQPQKEGTVVKSAAGLQEVKDLLEGGISLAEAVLPLTRPSNASQLMLFADSGNG